MDKPQFVLVTPVKDEARTIGQTIDSVVRQTVKPAEWIIVSDGSIDGTNEVVAAAAQVHPWIKLLALPGNSTRNFAAVVHNTERGIAALTVSDYRYIGLLDADLEFQQDYFELLFARFEANPTLGLAGGVVIDLGRPKDRFPRNRIDIPGAVQMFRRDCFEKLGGLVAIPEGGWDCLTCAMARMAGYQTELVISLVVDHLKPRNVSQGGVLKRIFQLGLRDYAIGYHPLFELAKCIGRWREPPVFVAGAAHFAGYCAGLLQGRPRVVPDHVVAFVRHEQLVRLRLASA